MNVLFVGLARVIWLFDLALLNPTGMNLRGVFEEIAKRYQFAKAPKNEIDFDEQHSLSFKGGTFVSQRKVPILVGLNIYSDGIVVDTMSSTDEARDFLIDLAKWLNDTYGLVVPKERKESFLSQIDFRMEGRLTDLNPRLSLLLKSLNGRVVSKGPFDVASIQFWTEDINKPGTAAPIKIERKISASFSANHYFSQAPMATKDHIALLNEFEAILSQGGMK
jgi:hypothetical protein